MVASMSSLNVTNQLALVFKLIVLSFKSYPDIHEIWNLNFPEPQTEYSVIKASHEEGAKYFPDGGSGLYSVDDFQGIQNE